MEVELSTQEINVLVQKLASETAARAGKRLTHLHIIMNGAFMFGADFARMYPGVISEMSFTRILRGYGPGTKPLPPRVVDGVPIPNPKRHHVLLDVVYEEGLTMQLYKRHVFRPDEERFNYTECYLVYKSGAHPTPNMLFGKTINPELFLTGYGMGPYRDFNRVCSITPGDMMLQ